MARYCGLMPFVHGLERSSVLRPPVLLAAKAMRLTLPQSEQARRMLLVHFSTWFHCEKAAAVAPRMMLFGNAMAAAAAGQAAALDGLASPRMCRLQQRPGESSGQASALPCAASIDEHVDAAATASGERKEQAQHGEQSPGWHQQDFAHPQFPYQGVGRARHRVLRGREQSRRNFGPMLGEWRADQRTGGYRAGAIRDCGNDSDQEKDACQKSEEGQHGICALRIELRRVGAPRRTARPSHNACRLRHHKCHVDEKANRGPAVC